MHSSERTPPNPAAVPALICVLCTLALVVASVVVDRAWGDEPADQSAAESIWRLPPPQEAGFEPGLGFVDGQLVNFVPRELQPRESVEDLVDDSPFAGFLPDVEAAQAADPNAAAPEVAEATTSEDIEVRSPASAAEVLQDSTAIQTVNIQRRSTIAFDPRRKGCTGTPCGPTWTRCWPASIPS
jgi:hypothetical protein